MRTWIGWVLSNCLVRFLLYLGFGASQLLNSFFEAYFALPDHKLPFVRGQDFERLISKIEDVLNLPKLAAPETEIAADQYIFTIALTNGAVGLTYQGDESTLPSGIWSARLSLSQSTTEAIFEVCRARKISVLFVVHASIAAITYAGAPVDRRTNTTPAPCGSA